MIEFKGYISGEAEKYYWKRARSFGIVILYIALTCVLPIILLSYYGIKKQLGIDVLELPIFYSILYVIVPLLTLIPKSNSEKKKLTPCKVFTDEEYLVLVLGDGTEIHKIISDAKELRDFGDFYEVVFSNFVVNNSFVCQKNLISKGTFSEFEAIFDQKIHKKY